jgi:hypothetical protein
MRTAAVLYLVIAGVIFLGSLAGVGRPEPTGSQPWRWCEFTVANEALYRSIPRCK